MTDAETVELERAAATMAGPPYVLDQETPPTRLNRAFSLISEGKVTTTEGVFSVVGSDRAYTVTPDGCACPASTKGRSKWCYHLVAAALWDRWQCRVTPGYTSLFGPEPSAPANLETEAAEDPMEEPVVYHAGLARRDPPATLPSRNLRPIAAIIHDLRQPLPEACVAVRTQQGQSISYLHWWDVVVLLDTYAPGWQGKIVRCEEFAREEIIDRRAGTLAQVQTCVVTYRLTIPCEEGLVSREAIGRESSHEPIPFGDLSSNASAQALTRAAAMFGVGVWLREKDQTTTALRQHLLKRGYEAFGLACEHQERDKEAALAGVLRQAGVTRRGEVPLWVLQRYGGRV